MSRLPSSPPAFRHPLRRAGAPLAVQLVPTVHDCCCLPRPLRRFHPCIDITNTSTRIGCLLWVWRLLLIVVFLYLLYLGTLTYEYNNMPENEIPPVHLELLDNPLYSRLRIPLRVRNGHTPRLVSYSECGNLNSTKIVVFNTGLLGSSLEGPLFFHDDALKANVRLITVDLPGVGESSTTLVEEDQQGESHQLEEWAEDVQEFVQQIVQAKDDDDDNDQAQPEIHLLGLSMGAPHIMATWARLLSQSNNTAIPTIASVTLAAPWVGDRPTNNLGLKLCQSLLPRFIQRWIPPLGGQLLSLLTYLQAPLQKMVRSRLKPLVRAEHEAVKYSHYQGPRGNERLINLALFSSKETLWDPILQQIHNRTTTKPKPTIRVFYGTDDAIVTREGCDVLVQWLREEADCRVDYRVVEGADHATVFTDHLATLLDV